MKQEKRTKAVIALAQAYETGNIAITNRVEAIIMPDDQKLPKQLEACLKTWGKTPIDESEFFELSQTATFEEMKAASVKDLNIDDFDALDIATLTNRLFKQITNKIDDDGKYKTTPNIDKVKLPKTTQLKAIKDLAISDAGEEKLAKEIFKVAGVKAKDLSDWEVALVTEMTYAYIQAVDSDLMGSFSDRTPFARYLGN